MGFFSNLKRSFEEANYMSKHPFQTHKRIIQHQDPITGEQLSWAGTRVDARIKNIRDTMEKYDINHPETIESIEEKIDEINMRLKTVSNKEERSYLLNELDYYYDELNKLKSSENTNSNKDYTR